MRKKGLESVVERRTGIKPDNKIPTVFHRHGPVETWVAIIKLPDQSTVMAQTSQEITTAYGMVAAGDSMVPYKSTADRSLAFALRRAVSTALMTEVGAFKNPPGLSINELPDTTYMRAIDALQQYGSANEKGAIARARKFIRSEGLRYQAKMLPSFIQAGLDMAMEHNIEDLNWWYSEFHSMYGTEDNQNPSNRKMRPEKDFTPKGFDMPMFPVKPDHEEPTASSRWGDFGGERRIPMAPWKHPTIRSSRSWKYSEFGVFKYPWRALPTSDYLCFSLQRRKYGGTVLVDMSGSMGVQQEQIDKLLNLAPYATVAGYGGSEDKLPGSSGHVVIMAEDCKKGDAKTGQKTFDGRNIVDGPALKWLAKMPRPRIWVSDGCVTGVNESQETWMRAECAQTCVDHSIVRIDSMDDLLKKIQ